MPSMSWLKPTDKKQAKWVYHHVRRTYPKIFELLNSNFWSEASFCSDLKTKSDSLWPDRYERAVILKKIRNAWEVEKGRAKRGTKPLTIQINPDIKQNFAEQAKFHRFTQAEFLEELLLNYQNRKTSDNEREVLEENSKLRSEIDSLKEQLRAHNNQTVEKVESKQNKPAKEHSAIKRVIEDHLPSGIKQTPGGG